jgi:GT2 family glycosyltransferase
MNFAVAVLTYNHPNITIDCLKSVEPLVPSELLYVIHNGSLSEHREKVQSEFPELQHVIMPENKGFNGGCNEAMRVVLEKYEWLYFLTNDITLLQLGPLPDVPGFYAPLIWRRKKDVVDSMGAAFIPEESKLYHLKTKEEFLNLPSGHLPYVPGTAFLIHREIFKQTGELDESLHTYWEDVDYSQRVRLGGLKMDLNLNFELIHKVGKTCHKDPFYTNHLFKRNRDIVSQRYRL